MSRHYLDYYSIPDINIPAFLMRICIYFLIILFLLLLFTGCAIVSYTGSPDGSTKVSIYSLGSDKVLEDFQAGINKAGDRNVSIGSYDVNQTEGMKQANQGLQMLVEGIVKGAVAGGEVMNGVSVQVNQQEVNAVYELLADIKGGAKKTLITALNSTLGYAVELTQKSIGEATTLEAKIIKENVIGEEARENTLATMQIFKGRIPLAQFRTRPTVINYRLGGRNSGVSVQVWKNRPAVQFKHAFFARMPNGHEGLFERRGKKRLPIDEMKGPSTATIYKNTPGMSARIEQLAAERLLNNLTDGVDSILGIGHG